VRFEQQPSGLPFKKRDAVRSIARGQLRSLSSDECLAARIEMLVDQHRTDLVVALNGGDLMHDPSARKSCGIPEYLDAAAAGEDFHLVRARGLFRDVEIDGV